MDMQTITPRGSYVQDMDIVNIDVVEDTAALVVTYCLCFRLYATVSDVTKIRFARLAYALTWAALGRFRLSYLQYG